MGRTRLLCTTADALRPKESVKTTGLFFIIGALPILAPFLIGAMWDSNPTIPAIIAFVLSLGIEH